MVLIRPARAEDGPVIAEIRAETWRAAYAGLIPAERLAELTAPEAVAREGALRAARSLGGHLIAEITGPGAKDDASPAEAGRTDNSNSQAAQAPTQARTQAQAQTSDNSNRPASQPGPDPARAQTW